MLLPETSFKEEDEEDEDFFEDEDNDSFITINTSEESGSDETLENSESNDSGVIEEPEFMMSPKSQRSYGISSPQKQSYGDTSPPQQSYEVGSAPQRSYGVNPIFAAHFNSQFEQDSLDGNAVTASGEFKYVKNTKKWKPASKSKKLQKTRKFRAKENQPSPIGTSDVAEASKLSVVRENETFAYNESCLI